jgi:hypothetical protein
VSRAVDALVAAWVLAWILAGIAVAGQVRDLAEISNHARDAGVATQHAADLLDDVPLIGDEAASTLRDAGASTIRSAERGRDKIRTLGMILGLIVAIVPSLPLLVFFLPGRLGLARERLAARGASDELLATRAVARLPLHRLQRVTLDPVADLREGRFEALARAERRRLSGARAR